MLKNILLILKYSLILRMETFHIGKFSLVSSEGFQNKIKLIIFFYLPK
jgi:hypothetical protein